MQKGFPYYRRHGARKESVRRDVKWRARRRLVTKPRNVLDFGVTRWTSVDSQPFLGSTAV
jgi:hypothetical protein